MTIHENHTTDDDGYDSVAALMRYEADELNEPEIIQLFQHLVDTGLAWKLQGHYGRRAREMLDSGSIQLPSRAAPSGDYPASKALFPLGQTVATARACDLLHADEIALGLARHVRGDWGNVCPEDARSNDEALQIGERLLSVYGKGERRFWIITERDRSVTTILLPEDY